MPSFDKLSTTVSIIYNVTDLLVDKTLHIALKE